jgi:hypothetical protein
MCCGIGTILERHQQKNLRGLVPSSGLFQNCLIGYWLDNHPIEEPSDVHFLQSKVLKEKDLAQKCIDKEANKNDSLQWAWSGKYP